MPAPEILPAYRIVAAPEVLDHTTWPDSSIVMRLAPDEVLLVGTQAPHIDDPYAIVEAETGFVGAEMTRLDLDAWFRREAEWDLPNMDNFFRQGMAAGLPVKIWVNGDRAIVATRTSLRHELEARL